MRHVPIGRAMFRRARFERIEDRLVFSTVPGCDSCVPADIDDTQPVWDWPVTRPELELLGPLASIPYVHDKYGLYGTGQTVAVIDSGIAYDHLALGGGFGDGYRVVGGADFTEENDADPYDDGPAGFHGTHVSGIIASQDDQYTGVAPNVDLVALRVFNDMGTGYIDWVEEALQWVHEHRNDFRFPISTVNLSLGTAWNGDSPPDGAQLEDELAALEQDGIFIAVAAGNSFSEYNACGLSYPAASSHVVAVSSVGSTGQLSDFSQRHPRALAAPGERITSTVPDAFLGADGYANDWMAASGTSMAAPYVAGASVLVREAMEFLGYESIDQATIYAQLYDTADRSIDAVTGMTYSTVNLGRAIEALMPVDDFGSVLAEAHDLGTIFDTATISGLLTSLDDRDVFQFTAGSTGQITLDVVAGQAIHVQVDGDRSDTSSRTVQQVFDVEAGQTYSFSLAALEHLASFDVTLNLQPDSPIRIDGDLIFVEGTAGDDVIELRMSSQLELIFNGQSFVVPPTAASQLQIIGLEGNDSLTIHGPATGQNLTLRPGSAELSSDQLEIVADGFEHITVVAHSNHMDLVRLHGSTGNDTFIARPEESSLSGEGYENRVVGFDRVFAYAVGGQENVAHFFDSAGDDLFIARPGFSFLRGEGFFNKAYQFEHNYGYASAGQDVARLYDSFGNDLFVAEPGLSYLRGDGFVNKAYRFEQNYAYASAGRDVARFYDSSGNDLFVARPIFSYLRGDGFLNKAYRFEQNDVHASAELDVAEFYDSSGDDLFVARPDFSHLRGDGFLNQTHRFERNYAWAARENDVAQLHDSIHDDLFSGSSNRSYLKSSDFFHQADHFDKVLATASNGGKDTAVLTGTAAEDRFVSDSEWAALEDSLSDQRVEGFGHVLLETDPAQLDNFYLAAVDYLFAIGRPVDSD